ncbi:ATP-binding protein [Kitasatospora sp. NPDC002040]|uniref:ATP-binding protein n=1 Tax=Kitasatospora sp. NPDC002040 TaxID=3154661 RepID=UPI00332A1DE2
MPTARFDLPARPDEVAPARHRVLHQLHAWEPEFDEETAADVELVVSELLTNAVVHAGGTRIGVSLSLSERAGRRRLRVEVSDRGSAPLARRPPASPDQEGGRGLALVEALSSRCGSTRNGHGKDCWAELALPGCPGRWPRR